MLIGGRVFPALICAAMLTGCGLSVPETRDFPNNTTPVSNDLLVQAIIISVHCELEDAVTRVINDDAATAHANGSFYAQFLRGWGAQVALTLTLDERSIVNPTGTYTSASTLLSIFSLSGALSATAEALRIEKVNYYYKVTELYLGPHRKCERDINPPRDSLLIRSDLKLYEWLSAFVTGAASGVITSAGKQNVLSHEIAFELVASGSLTPAWTLVRGSVNQGGALLTGIRNRRHDLLITFGPLDNTQSGSFLIPIAEQTHISSQVISGVSGGLRNTPGQ
jgi:hypothetical protein